MFLTANLFPPTVSHVIGAILILAFLTWGTVHYVRAMAADRRKARRNAALAALSIRTPIGVPLPDLYMERTRKFDRPGYDWTQE